MPHSILPHHTHSFYFLAEAVHLQITSVASVCLFLTFSPYLNNKNGIWGFRCDVNAKVNLISTMHKAQESHI